MTVITPGAAHDTAAGALPATRASYPRSLRAANLSPLTLRTYADAVDRLTDFLVAHELPTDVAAIRRPHLEAFMADQLERWKPATAANRYRGLRRFFAWLVEEGEIRTDPTERLRPPCVPKQPPAVLSEDEQEKPVPAELPTPVNRGRVHDLSEPRSRQTRQPRPQRAFEGDVRALTPRNNVVDLKCSPEMAAYVRDALYHLVDDPLADERYGEREVDLLEILADCIADAFDAKDEWMTRLDEE